MTNPTNTPKIWPNRDKTGPSGALSRAKRTQFPQAQSGGKRHNESDLEQNRRISRPPKQTQTNPISPGILSPVERISASHQPHPSSQISDLKSAAPTACAVIVRAKQTQFRQPETDDKIISHSGLQRISSQAACEKQTQTKPTLPPWPPTPGRLPGPCRERPGASIDRMSPETHTKGSFCTGPDAAPDNPTSNLGLGRVPASPARPGEGGSENWDRP
jgi:hypothetical protein